MSVADCMPPSSLLKTIKLTVLSNEGMYKQELSYRKQIARHNSSRASFFNGATKLKLYSYIGIGKYLGVSKCFR